MPHRDQLPVTIRELALYHAATVRSGRDFDKDMESIVEKIDEWRQQWLRRTKIGRTRIE
jgi:hypothetical protein